MFMNTVPTVDGGRGGEGMALTAGVRWQKPGGSGKNPPSVSKHRAPVNI